MSLYEIDTFLSSFINKGLQNSIFDIAMPILTDRYYFLILAIMLWLVIKNKKAAIVPIALTLIAVGLSDAISNIFKHLIERPRPCHTLESIRLLVGCGDSFSMPSNHAANAFAIILALSYKSKKWLRLFLLSVAISVGFSRIYVGVHYLSDVIVGSFIGLAFSVSVIKLYEWSARRYQSYPYTTILINTLLLIGLFRIYYITLGIIDLSPDEAHYWEWSRRLDLSYYSKGPMIAYLIALGTSVFGDNVFGIRVMAVIFSAMSSIFLYKLGKGLFDERTGTSAAILMQIIPLYSAYGVLFTIDSPFIFFWILSLYLFYRAVEQQNSSSVVETLCRASALKYWLFLGISIGLGLLTKYTMAFFYLSVFLFLFTSKSHRRLLSKKGIYISIILSLIIFSPVIVWNARHDWVTLRHTAGQAHLSDGWSAISSNWLTDFLEFLGSQIGIITPIIFFMIFYAIFRLWTRDRDQKIELQSKFLFWFSIPIIAFFMLKSLHGKVQANWALPGYATGFLAFSALFIGKWESNKKWLKTATVAGCIIAISTTSVAHFPSVLKLPTNLDPRSRIKGWEDLGIEASRLADEFSKTGPLFIFSDRYQVSSELAFYVKRQPITYCINLDRRMNQYDLWPGFDKFIHYNAIFVTIGDAKTPGLFRTAFDKCENKTFIVYSGGSILREYSISVCYDFKGIPQKEITSY